ncbi:TIGR04561 family membrane protein [Spiroplasma turonicum]|uniref:Transmembrane protein n=1 Tax=Spiroplasma turonicum TaxID=216946 RepID=A0A0K1P778_9MOLU|nr:TIGR04561 family membrane protein [Spiroplasma turonicum]AKU80049.1 hypothetical protein STURON_00803 [Spiroplasma turonicum]ALX71051.1 hypothetical protein STURO_v1c08000 [Spiroplasma turonicum]
MINLLDFSFKVLDFSLSLWVVLLIFSFIGIICLVSYLYILFKKNRKFIYEKEEVSADEFKRLEKFENLRNDFEIEIAKVRKTYKSNLKRK